MPMRDSKAESSVAAASRTKNKNKNFVERLKDEQEKLYVDCDTIPCLWETSRVMDMRRVRERAIIKPLGSRRV